MPQNTTLFGNNVVADVISEDQVVLEQGGPLIQLSGILMKRGDLDTDTHIGGTPCEDEGKDRGDASTS